MYPSSESGNIPAIPSQPYRQQETSRAAAHLRTVHPVGVFFSREVRIRRSRSHSLFLYLQNAKRQSAPQPTYR